MAELRRDEGFYRALFEVNPAIKLLIDPRDGRIVDANQAAESFYGHPREAMRAMRISEINVLTPEEVRDEMENARIGRRRYFRFRHRISSGEIRHVEVHTGPVEIDGVQLLLSIIHDVTDRDVLESQLRESQRLEALGRVAGALAHDFNNLLTVIMANAQVLARSFEPRSSLTTRAEDVLYAARRGATLTAELLAFSRRRATKLERVSLLEVVHHTRGVISRTLGPRYRVELDAPETLPPTRVDASQVEQALINLALNARDAMRGGGRLIIRCDAASGGAREAPELPPGRWVRVSVEDEGEGMPPEVQRRVFEPFFTTKPEGRGTGLGLATVLGVVSQCGGHVTLRSEPGVGSTFTLHFPANGGAEEGDLSSEHLIAEALVPELRQSGGEA